ncbi:CHAP domain-containing protein, partial [Candidatus Gracilibacteria bacterium]|nr:CHAP domain-containing protein [Candidatus Gracilibacteria bacterium]
TTAAQQNYTSSGMYSLRWRKPFSGAYGNCTYYVASYKNVNWRGNANQWLYRARAKGHATGNYAKAGAIIVLGGRGYNTYYGHVGIVRSVEKNHLIISDMNYRAYNQVTVRKIARYGSHVKGYIYVGD